MTDIFETFKARYPDMMENVYCGFDLPPGWAEIVDRLCAALVQAGFNGKVAQVKEKFGGLRFYADEVDETHEKLIRAAESESFKTCEVCGKTALPRTDNYFRQTLCEEHTKGDW